MSDKRHDALNVLDRMLREAHPEIGPNVPGIKLKIEMIHGFELFNTRPYHNYETWSDGYRIFDDNVMVEAEDLDDAVAKFHKAVKAYKEGRLPPRQRRTNASTP